MGSLSLLQGIFPTQGWNPGLHCTQIPYHLSCQGSPNMHKLKVKCCSVVSNSLWPHGLYRVHRILQARTLEWVAVPLSRGSSQPRDHTQVSCITGVCFTSWATREAQYAETPPHYEGRLECFSSMSLSFLIHSISAFLILAHKLIFTLSRNILVLIILSSFKWIEMPLKTELYILFWDNQCWKTRYATY